MKKKIAVILGGLYNPPDINSVRGSYFYTHNFILSLALRNEVHIYYPENISIESLPHHADISYIKITEPLSAEFLENKKYDFVWNMTEDEYKKRKFISFDVRHAHSAMYRQKYTRSRLEYFMKKIFDKKRCLTKEQIYIHKYTLSRNDILFANSKIAAKDYIELGGLKENQVCILSPMIIHKEQKPHERFNKVFTFGISAVSFSLKGGFIFLNALFLLKLNGLKFKASIIYPNYKKNLLVRAAVLLYGLKNDVKFLEFQNSMDDFYNSIDCLVMPSREETFGLTGLEAMQNKCPVIVSNAAGIADIIEHGKNGFIFDIHKRAASNLAREAAKIMSCKNLYEIKENGYKTAEDNTLEKHSRRLDIILDSLLRKRDEKIYI